MIENENITLFLEMWDIFKSYIPHKDRLEAAEHAIQLLDRYNIDIEIYASELSESCSTLSKVISSHLSLDEEEIED